MFFSHLCKSPQDGDISCGWKQPPTMALSVPAAKLVSAVPLPERDATSPGQTHYATICSHGAVIAAHEASVVPGDLPRNNMKQCDPSTCCCSPYSTVEQRQKPKDFNGPLKNSKTTVWITAEAIVLKLVYLGVYLTPVYFTIKLTHYTHKPGFWMFFPMRPSGCFPKHGLMELFLPFQILPHGKMPKLHSWVSLLSTWKKSTDGLPSENGVSRWFPEGNRSDE